MKIEQIIVGFSGCGALATVLALGVMSGCHSPKGGFMPASFGSTTYHSTETMPKTITIIDLRTEDEIFVMDIPPGKQLTLDFVADGGDDPVYSPDLMRYEVWDMGQSWGRLRNSMTVPPANSRRIDVSIRRGIEYAEAPPEERYRVDEAGRPEWWTPQGGPMPDGHPAELYDQ